MKISSLALTLALFPAALISTSIRAVAGPTPTEVQGVVEVLNDVLYTPYSRSVLTADGSLPWANFDVPAGKRLIIETISFQGLHPTAKGVKRVLMEHTISANTRITIPLVAQERVVDGSNTFLIATLPVKMRIDSVLNDNKEILIRMGGSTPDSSGRIMVAIHGYLIDL
jgi:hypothetical protein